MNPFENYIPGNKIPLDEFADNLSTLDAMAYGTYKPPVQQHQEVQEVKQNTVPVQQNVNADYATELERLKNIEKIAMENGLSDKIADKYMIPTQRNEQPTQTTQQPTATTSNSADDEWKKLLGLDAPAEVTNVQSTQPTNMQDNPMPSDYVANVNKYTKSLVEYSTKKGYDVDKLMQTINTMSPEDMADLVYGRLQNSNVNTTKQDVPVGTIKPSESLLNKFRNPVVNTIANEPNYVKPKQTVDNMFAFKEDNPFF